MNRAYSILEIKAVKEDERVIEGIASTPTVDRQGDIVEPMGAQFKLPMPLLWQHRASEPVGNVTFAKPTKDGIPFKAKIEQTNEPGKLKERLDEAWQSVKLGLVRAVSIGFSINAYEILKEGGWRINEWEWLELSLVTIPANAEATINTVKSIDSELLAASGHKQNGVERTVKAGVTASKSTHAVKGKKVMAKKSTADLIRDLEATRQTKADDLNALQTKVTDEGRTKDASEREQFDTLNDEIKALDAEIVDLKAIEKMNLSKAVEPKGGDADAAGKSRAGITVEVKGTNVPKGIAFTRLLKAKYMSSKMHVPAADIAKANWPDMPELQTVLKTAVDPMNMTNASALVEPQIMASEFIEYLWPRTIIGRIPGLRKVPFNIKVQRQTSVASVNWVGEGKPKPVSKGAFDTVTLGNFKIAGIIGMSDEVLRFSNPKSDELARDDLAAAIIKLMDKDFLDPEKTASAGVSPASVTNGVTGVSATGTAYSNFVANFASVMDNFDAAEIDTADLVVVTRSRQARKLGLMLNSLGQPLFPGLGATGGTMLGYPVITSNNVDYTEDSPQEGDNIIFIKPSEIFLADDGGVTVDMSSEASVQMNDAPDSPASASTVLISAFQHNLVFVRAERYINWLKRRDAAVQYIKAANYA